MKDEPFDCELPEGVDDFSDLPLPGDKVRSGEKFYFLKALAALNGGTPPQKRFQKRMLRRILLYERNSLTKSQQTHSGRRIARRIEESGVLQTASALFLYYPVGSEPNLLPLAENAQKRGIPVAFPVCNVETKTLTFRQASPGVKFHSDAYGIPAPSETEPTLTADSRTVCVVPALGFDHNLIRIGYGGGYYDRFLRDFPGVAVGVCNDDFLLGVSFSEPHDVPTDFLATESRFLEAPNPRKKAGF